MSVWRDILDYILPPRCLQCGRPLHENTGLCKTCFADINFIVRPYCQRCGHPLETDCADNGQMLCGRCLRRARREFRLSRSAFAYDEGSKRLILNFKFNDRTENARFLAQTMYVAGADIFAAGVDVIVPVPLHFTRLFRRRYNQSALLASELGKLSGCKAETFALVKHRRTRPQVELSGLARVRNLRGAFSVAHAERIVGKRVLLVDDVLTTGSTLRECARVLRKAGAKSVDTLTAARVI